MKTVESARYDSYRNVLSWCKLIVLLRTQLADFLHLQTMAKSSYTMG